MTRRRSRHYEAALRARSGRRGVVLVLVLIAIVFAGTLMALVASSLAQQGKLARLQQERVVIQQVADSARTWAELHPEAFNAGPVALDPTPMLPVGSTGDVQVSLVTGADGRRAVRIGVTVTLERHTARVSMEFPYMTEARPSAG